MLYSLSGSALSFLLCLACLSSTVTGAVTLVTDYDDYACPNTNAVIRCTTDTGQLVWTSGGNQAYSTSSSLNVPHSVGSFTVRLISKLGSTLESTAVINATSSNNGSTVICGDSFSAGGMTDTAVILLATIPSQPLNFINTTTTYDSVVLNWTTPTSLGGVAIDQYRVTISPSLQSSCPGQCMTTGNNTESLTITNLQYGVTYTITVAASNCAGIGQSQTLNVTITAIGKCLTDCHLCLHWSQEKTKIL
ncbi:PREDICTED: uncharacterized protein LOC109591591 [Amphimedon queenslandica]|uniref:Fibronectin type-III domain-containing protein n=2 Tax=Amphimedon queenslandica TaxID=400682 RepID=A0AAN0K116_AMPQE|nr:PREDICTED: uncharacterized protein LOC109591591 [Amphimedon queenslandica]|eukprot:XP_019862857.1 PREDICTED: uncharacterized protein LOC109591591 [Amphimedon queenslandica]